MSDARCLWLSLCVVALGCSSGDCDLQDDLRLFAGEGAIDCGTADATHDRADVDQCAFDAFDAGSPFFARYEVAGTDSKLLRAVAMNTVGVVKAFRWDSAPCGKGQACDPATDVQTCEDPSLVLESREDEAALPLECKSFGLPQRVCG